MAERNHFVTCSADEPEAIGRDSLEAEGAKYCSEYRENAEKAGVIEIGCSCEHAVCR